MTEEYICICIRINNINVLAVDVQREQGANAQVGGS